MNCPRCKAQITEKDLVCPECKKVLKLKCHICGEVTKNSTCEKCGSVLLNKCYKCGRLNSTALEKCPKCGLDINASIGLRESVIEEFAVLTIEITNFEDIKTAFKSDKLTKKFKHNLYEMIKKLAKRKKLRVQFIDDTFIIRFCKDDSFSESCSSAIDFSIYVAQSVTEINEKLFDAKGVAIKAQMAVQKRDVYAKPAEYKSGLNINVVYSSSGRSHLFNNVEVVVDSYVYQETKIKYPYLSLSAILIKNKMIMFFELVLHQLIKLEKNKDEEAQDVIKLPKNVDYEPEEEADEALINFSGLHCTFLKSKNEEIPEKLAKIHEQTPENIIITISGNERSGKLAQLSTKTIQNIFDGMNILRFACPKKNKYSPFGLFKQMLLSYRNITESDFLMKPELVEAISQEKCIQDLFLMQLDGHTHPEDLRYTYFEAFTGFVRSIPYKTLFVIEDIENADEGSIEIIKYLIENKSLSNISFLFSSDESYALHRKIHKLMTSNNYFEIQLRPTSNKNIVIEKSKELKDIEKTFFFEKVLENTKGSSFYFSQAMEYLRDDRILEFKNGKYKVLQDRMLVIPKNINELVQKRVLHLKNIKGAYELFGSLLLIGEKVSFSVLQQLEIKDFTKLLKYFEEENLITLENNNLVKAKNFNLYRTNFIASCSKDELYNIIINLLEKIYIKIQIPNCTKAELLELAELKKEAFSQWHAIAMVSSQMGDFCAYLNSTNKFLSLVGNVIDPQTDTTVEQVKMEVYSELASMLYKYYPDKIMNFLQMLLENLESQNDDKKIKEVANKLVQSCLISGNYHNALEYIGKIISRTPRSSFNPKDKSFNLNYFLVNMVTLEIYYNLGRLSECIELADELFKYIDLSEGTQNILPEGFSKKQFDDAILDALFFVSLSRIIQLKSDAKEYIQTIIEKAPQNYTCFKLLILLADFLTGEDIIENMTQIAQQGLNDKYSQILFPMLQAMISLKFQDWNNLGNYIYNAKIQASSLHFHQMELFCELMIGYAYQNLGNLKKASQIYLSITDTSSDKGLKNITYLSWYLNAKIEFQQGNLEIAANILNNAMLSMENDENISDYFIMLFKTFYAELMLHRSKFEEALFCTEQAFDIAVKNRLVLNLPKIADMLAFIYNQILSSGQPAEIQEIYKNKFKNLQQVMSQVMQSTSAN
ncbi:MAG: hypothetical protein KHX03_01890 [Clostridium sp.]|nr:hypothetical protein [Clostridium sp.]